MPSKFIITLLFVGLIFTGCFNKTSHAYRLKQVVVLQPLKSFPDSLLPIISKHITAVYGFQVQVAPVKPIPEKYFNNDKGPRYSADAILRYLLQERSDAGTYIAGLTTADIFTSKEVPSSGNKLPLSTYKNWGIFGLGLQPGKSNIVSIHRLGTGQLMVSRLKKIVIHEVGHNLGLDHCPQPGCVMNDAMESIRTIDRENGELCEACKRKIN